MPTRVVGDTTLRTLGASAGVGGSNADAGANPEDRATPINPVGEVSPEFMADRARFTGDKIVGYTSRYIGFRS